MRKILIFIWMYCVLGAFFDSACDHTPTSSTTVVCRDTAIRWGPCVTSTLNKIINKIKVIYVEIDCLKKGGNHKTTKKKMRSSPKFKNLLQSCYKMTCWHCATRTLPSLVICQMFLKVNQILHMRLSYLSEWSYCITAIQYFSVTNTHFIWNQILYLEQCITVKL